ncbi:hypothetical protein KR074_007512 [Drosophila pseudoananassae]|nr:hypothetical protein KR074_007512 [Drosophila pseudoananassae]
MENHSQTRILMWLWICLVIRLSVADSQGTMTTICVEIRPSGPQEEPYYMCRGASFGSENGQKSCVEVRNEGGQGEPLYMCRGVEYFGPGGESRPLPEHFPVEPHTFPSFPAFGGGKFQQSLAQEGVPPSHPPTYQEQSTQPQPPLEQPQPAAQYRFHGIPMAAPALPSQAQPYGLPAVSYPPFGGPTAAPPGAPVGPGPAATASPHDPAAAARAGNLFRDHIVGSNRHKPAFDDDVLGMPNIGHNKEELNQQYRRPVDQQMVWVPLTHSQDPQNDPVMKAFYKSLATDPVVGQAGPGYAPPQEPYQQNQGPPTLPPAPPAYALPEAPSNYCSECSASTPAVQCPANPTMDNGMAYIPTCPSFQPVIIAMPCYGSHQPGNYLPVARSGPPVLPAPGVGSPFGVPRPFGGAFGLGGQVGSSFGGTTQMGDQHVGGPFGMGLGLNPILNPFGPFGNLNPFNPFNRVLGSPNAATTPPHPNIFQNVFQPFEGVESTTTSDSSSSMDSPTERTGKLNFSASTPAPPSTTQSVTVGAAHESTDDQDSDEDDDDGADQETTALPAFEDNASASDADSKELTAKQLVNKAADLLKPEKRKRHNSRSNNPQKRKYLQQL